MGSKMLKPKQYFSNKLFKTIIYFSIKVKYQYLVSQGGFWQVCLGLEYSESKIHRTSLEYELVCEVTDVTDCGA